MVRDKHKAPKGRKGNDDDSSDDSESEGQMDMQAYRSLLSKIFPSKHMAEKVKEMEEVDTCLLDCASSVLGGGGDIDACLKAQCPEAQSKIGQCASPAIDRGVCDGSFVSCSATL